ncbi:EGF-like repeat and discoidin I-like domain-containing protein 3 [Varanus komodoensis]|nr:EGF-like repeat and discoidin I-like domain-containing protein 3 [Varanus komodoensis]
MTCPSWVTLHSIAHSFIELRKPLRHDKAIDLLVPTKVTGIITQGAKDFGHVQFVGSYKLAYSNDGDHWTIYQDEKQKKDKALDNYISTRQKVFHSRMLHSMGHQTMARGLDTTHHAHLSGENDIRGSRQLTSSPPSYPHNNNPVSLASDSLPELTEIVSDLVLKTPRMLVLGDFNLHAETVLTGAAQDFMASMMAMGLSQHVIGPTHEHGHTLDLVFSTGQEEGDLRMSNLCLTPLSWSDHFLMRFELDSGLSLCKGADRIVLVHPQSRMDPDGFLKALGKFPVDKAGAPVDALVELWNGEMARAIDTIAPKCLLLSGRACSSPWYTPELWAMKRVGRHLEHRWRKSQDESDRACL